MLCIIQSHIIRWFLVVKILLIEEEIASQQSILINIFNQYLSFIRKLTQDFHYFCFGQGSLLLLIDEDVKYLLFCSLIATVILCPLATHFLRGNDTAIIASYILKNPEDLLFDEFWFEAVVREICGVLFHHLF